MKGRNTALRIMSVVGALIGYGALIAFLCLVGLQIYRWFREGEWTHIGTSDGLRMGLERCCTKDGDNGRIAAFLQWLDAPVDWLGMHKVLEVVPASLTLFALAVIGNSLFVYCRDGLERRH